MWLIFARAPPPEVKVWKGRRALAFVDAVAWPVAWATFILGLPVSTGLAGQCLLAHCCIAAARRAYRAVAKNGRYHFTTWRWGRVLGLALAFGCALKLAAMFSA